MQDFETLRARVEETAQRMRQAQTQRTESHQSLVDILGSLESKFAAQEEELAFYKGRIGPLEHSNAQFSELIGKLLDLVESGFGEDSLAPMRHATEMASAMLSSEMATVRPADPAIDAPGRFEDVEPEMLATEAGASEEDLEDLPEVVRRGLIEQQTEAFQNAIAQQDEPETEMVAEDGEEPEPVAEIEETEEPVAAAPEPAVPPAETIETVEALASALDQKSAAGEPLEASDIKALLERVEALANQPGDDDDDIDIPPTRDEDQGIELFKRERKTGTEG